MKVNGMRVIGLVLEHQPVTPAFAKHARLGLVVITLAVDGPAIEAAGSPVDLAEYQRDGLLEGGHAARIAKERVVPRLLCGRDPARRSGLARVLDHDTHAVHSIVVLGSA